MELQHFLICCCCRVIFFGGRVKKTSLQSCKCCSQTDGPSSALSRHLAADLLIPFSVCVRAPHWLKQEMVKHPVTKRWVRISSDLSLEKRSDVNGKEKVFRINCAFEESQSSSDACLWPNSTSFLFFPSGSTCPKEIITWGDICRKKLPYLICWYVWQVLTQMCEFQLQCEFMPTGLI